MNYINIIQVVKIQSWFRGYVVRKLLKVTFNYYQDICRNIDNSIKTGSHPNYESDRLNQQFEIVTPSSSYKPIHRITSAILYPVDRIDNQLMFVDGSYVRKHDDDILKVMSYVSDTDYTCRDKELSELIKEAEWIEKTIMNRIHTSNSINH